MKASDIRQTYLSFFEERGHKIVPSASLVPSAHDPSVLLTTAGMQPFKSYFLGREEPPARRLADVQKSMCHFCGKRELDGAYCASLSSQRA